MVKRPEGFSVLGRCLPDIPEIPDSPESPVFPVPPVSPEFPDCPGLLDSPDYLVSAIFLITFIQPYPMPVIFFLFLFKPLFLIISVCITLDLMLVSFFLHLLSLDFIRTYVIFLLILAENTKRLLYLHRKF